MGEILSAVFDEIRYMRVVYFFLLAMALWGALRAGPRRSARPAGTALLLLILLSWSPVSWSLNALLEYPYRQAEAPPPDVEAVVLFSGGSFDPQFRQPFTYLDSGTNLRCRTAARVHHAAGRPPVVVCGPSRPGVPDANPVWDLMARELEAWGVEEPSIRIERAGRSTYEQALGAAELLREMGVRRVAVVTEGFHMRRAAGALQRLGFETFPAPAGSRSFPSELDWRYFIPSPQVFGASEEALREMAALVVYKVRGRI